MKQGLQIKRVQDLQPGDRVLGEGVVIAVELGVLRNDTSQTPRIFVRYNGYVNSTSYLYGAKVAIKVPIIKVSWYKQIWLWLKRGKR